MYIVGVGEYRPQVGVKASDGDDAPPSRLRWFMFGATVAAIAFLAPVIASEAYATHRLASGRSR